MEQPANIAALFQRYLDNCCEIAEVDELMRLFRSGENSELLEELIMQQLAASPGDMPHDAALKERLNERLHNMLAQPQHAAPGTISMRGHRKWWAAAAAVILLAISTYYLLWNYRKPANDLVKTTNEQNDVLPGGNKAILTIAGGKQIILDSASKGRLALQGNSEVVKTDSGALTYTAITNPAASAIVYNTLTTPRGGQYHLTLQDGTKVWLNAASSITYPTAFTGKQRNVNITGEVYFEVIKDPGRKFIVSCNGVQTEVLGTRFNVNTYEDENNMTITLLEGAVKVIKGNATGVLKPGQQASISSGIAISKDVNTDEITAWKNGFFHFESADLKTILRQFARWYDIQIIYEGNVSNEKYFSIISRHNSLLEVLASLQANGIRFRLSNKKLYIQS